MPFIYRAWSVSGQLLVGRWSVGWWSVVLIKPEKQIILQMIPKKEKERWHYLAVKKLSTLLRGIKDGIILQLKNCLCY